MVYLFTAEEAQHDPLQAVRDILKDREVLRHLLFDNGTCTHVYLINVLDCVKSIVPKPQIKSSCQVLCNDLWGYVFDYLNVLSLMCIVGASSFWCTRIYTSLFAQPIAALRKLIVDDIIGHNFNFGISSTYYLKGYLSTCDDEL